jgi:hypothetical protein
MERMLAGKKNPVKTFTQGSAEKSRDQLGEMFGVSGDRRQGLGKTPKNLAAPPMRAMTTATKIPRLVNS